MKLILKSTRETVIDVTPPRAAARNMPVFTFDHRIPSSSWYRYAPADGMRKIVLANGSFAFVRETSVATELEMSNG